MAEQDGDQPAFAGINTFLKAPYPEDVKQVGAHEVAIVGAPSTWPSTLFEELNIVDVGDVEVSPPYDSGDITSLLASRSILDVLVAEGKLGRRAR